MSKASFSHELANGIKKLRLSKLALDNAGLHLICGDAPSTYSEFAEFLVDCGIDSISLSSDALLRTRDIIAKHEKSISKSSIKKRSK
jgi:phosphoenolpyruvate-protein kinase (PTS system EI component)